MLRQRGSRMNWKYLFDREALGEGRKIYVGGAVTLLPGMPGGFLANVLDDGIYQVSVTVSNDRIAAVSCTCREGKNGRRCRHMAATLYEIDALSDKLTETREQMESESASYDDERIAFPVSESEDYQYFRLSRILRDTKITRGQYARAKEMINEKRIRLIRFRTEYNAQGTQILTCYGELAGGDTTGSVLYDMVQKMTGVQNYTGIARAFNRRGASQDLVRITMDADKILERAAHPDRFVPIEIRLAPKKAKKAPKPSKHGKPAQPGKSGQPGQPPTPNE